MTNRTRYCHTERPRFKTPEEWLNSVRYALAEGWGAWPPATRDELLLADAEGLLESRPQWIPCAAVLRLLGLPPHFGRQDPEFPAIWGERLVATFYGDRDLCRALEVLLRGVAS